MTLLELLVKELPARGGWPQKAVVAAGYSHVPGVHFWDDEGERVDFDSLINMPAGLYSVSRGQYEATIKPPEWNGEGLPPVGEVIEVKSPRFDWCKAVVIAVTDNWIIAKYDDGTEFAGCHRFLNGQNEWKRDFDLFRPIRTEADRKREEFIDRMSGGVLSEKLAGELYNAIVAHKIPGVTTVPSVGEIMRATESCSREDAQKIVDLLNGA